jgi:hypothetical protein
MEEPPLPPSSSTLSKILDKIDVNQKSSADNNGLI